MARADNFTEASPIVDKPVIKLVDADASVNYGLVIDGLAWGFADDQGSAGNAGQATLGNQRQVTLTTGNRVKF